VYRRSWAEGTATDGSRAGWSKEQSNPKLFVQATVYLAELAGDVGARFVEAVESRILGTHDLAPLVLPAQRTRVRAPVLAALRTNPYREGATRDLPAFPSVGQAHAHAQQKLELRRAAGGNDPQLPQD
jgi:hypothetical protein